jgi:hypothetical protein
VAFIHYVSLNRLLATLVSGLRLHGALFVSIIGRLLGGPAAAFGIRGFREGGFVVALFVKLSGSMMGLRSGLMILSGFGMTGARHGDLLFLL